MDRRAFLKNSLVALAGAGSVSSLAGCNGEFYGKKNSKKTNIILIMVDDVGYSDIGSFATHINNTPA
jgi:hypothetical protein